MPIGGSYGRPPIRSAWEQTRGKVESMMVEEMKSAFDAAARELADKVRSLQGPF
jgi:hypothetical protein